MRIWLIPALLLAENLLAQGPEPTIVRYGLPGAMIILIVALWREDRKARIEAQSQTDTRYTELVSRLLTTVEGNTSAVQSLRDGLSGKVNACPFQGQEQAVLARLDGLSEYAHKTRHELVSMLSGHLMATKAEQR